MPTFPTVNAGDPFVPSVQVENAIRAFLKSNTTVSRGDTNPAIITPSVIRVKNNTGSDCARYSILALGALVFTEAQPGYRDTPVINADNPAATSHRLLCVLNEDIKADGIGMATIAGFCIIKITSASGSACGRATMTASSVEGKYHPGGPFRVLARDGTTGFAYAILEACPDTFICDLLSDGGSAGTDAPTDCSWTYKVRHVGDTYDHATGISPTHARWPLMDAATHGLGYIKSDGSIGIWWSDEAPQAQGCP